LEQEQLSHFIFSVMQDRNTRSLNVKLIALPTQRYRRQVVREKIDIVVSIGGILGLFMGASILSLVELIYFFTIRFCGTSYQQHQKAQ
jgi:amiloride-sensitive sodium channel